MNVPDIQSSSSAGRKRSWDEKEIRLPDVSAKIPNGSAVFIQSCASTCETILDAMVSDVRKRDIQIIQMIPGGDLPHLREDVDRFRTSSFFPLLSSSAAFYKDITINADGTDNSGSGMPEHLQDYTPISITQIPRLLEEGILTVDIALIKVTKPHKAFCSLGLGVECTRDFLKHAKVVIAEVTSQMPWTEGHDSKLSLNEIDYWINLEDTSYGSDTNNGSTTISPGSARLKTTEELYPQYIKRASTRTLPGSIYDKIGMNIIKEIPDGATLKFGWSPIAYSVFPYLHERKDLGLHTDVLTETMFRLHEQGVFNNSKKTIDRGCSIVAQAHGSQALYEFCDRNPAIEFHSVRYVNDPARLAQIKKLVVLEGALKVDLTGQVTTDSIAHKFYGGVWCVQESIQGARFSDGGKSIIALPSKSSQGRSNIVFELPPGTGVTITRSDIEYVVTEYGIAYLYGKAMRERCLALIEIAHPEFRRALLQEAKKHHYISENQPGLSFETRYPSEFESLHTTSKGRSVTVRPIKATDEDLLRSFFHKLSDHSVYLRYFRKMRSLPQRILQQFTDLDYSKDMALVTLHYPQTMTEGQESIFSRQNHCELVGIAQWIVGASIDTVDRSNSERRGMHAPEIAFQVRDDWHGQGLGRYLFLRLVDISRAYGYTQFKADVLVDNKSMRHVFETSGIKYTTSSDFGTLTYYFELPPKGGETYDVVF